MRPGSNRGYPHIADAARCETALRGPHPRHDATRDWFQDCSAPAIRYTPEETRTHRPLDSLRWIIPFPAPSSVACRRLKTPCWRSASPAISWSGDPRSGSLRCERGSIDEEYHERVPLVAGRDRFAMSERNERSSEPFVDATRSALALLYRISIARDRHRRHERSTAG
jgi:hypothetical protein